ncbi:MAG: purine-nucleoside phosphorylase [Oscillospiraceae bacterium]
MGGDSMCFYDKVSALVAWIREKTEQIPELGVILGSGLGGLADELEERVVIPYDEIPNFPRSRVEGHAGNLVIGSIGGKTVAALQGRFHYYEGFSMKEVTFPVYVLRLLGVRDLIVTNACGGINRSFAPGDLMLITDYINMLGQNSLMGNNHPRFGPRLPDMSEPYAAKWIRLADVWRRSGQSPIRRGLCCSRPLL